MYDARGEIHTSTSWICRGCTYLRMSSHCVNNFTSTRSRKVLHGFAKYRYSSFYKFCSKSFLVTVLNFVFSSIITYLVEIARIAVYNESLWYGNRDKYTAEGYDNVWRNAVYRIMLWRGTCHRVCLVVSLADRMVG